MPRDINGNYTLPAGNPVVPQTIIETDWANPTMEDIAQALTQSLSRTGQGGMLVPFLNADGSANTPGISWANEPTSGFYRLGAGSFGYAVGTVPIFTISAAGITMAATRRVSVPDGSTGQQAVNFNQLSAAIAGIEPYLSTKREQQTATLNQTEFTLTTMTYLPNVNNVAVYQNGLRLFAGDYVETSPTVITLTTPAALGDVLQFSASESVTLTNPVIIDGGTIDNTVIGGTTPAAGTFTRVNSSIFSSASTGNIAFTTFGGMQFNVGHIANAVNNLQIRGAATNNQPLLAATGVDTNIGISYSTKGNSEHNFWTRDFAARAFQIRDTIGAVDFVSVMGAAAGGIPVVGVRGANVNASIAVVSRGNGSVFLSTNDGAAVQFEVATNPNAVNRLQVQGGSVGNAVILQAAGADTNIATRFRSKGTGGHVFQSHDGTSSQLQISGIASAVNFINMQGAVTGSAPMINAAGSGANANLTISSRSTGSISLSTNTGAQEQVRIVHIPNAVAYLSLAGAPSNGAPTISVLSGEANNGLQIVTRGVAFMDFMSGAGVANTRQFQVRPVSGAVNHLFVSGAGAAGFPILAAEGSDTNVGIVYRGKGVGSHVFQTGAGAGTLAIISGQANAVNHMQIIAASGTTFPSLQAIGPGTNVGMNFVNKGTGAFNFTDTTGQAHFQVFMNTGPIANFVIAGGAAAGTTPGFNTVGTDTNIDLRFTPKGTGVLRFGTHTVNADAPVVGYITIRDAAGTLRKLAVIA